MRKFFSLVVLVAFALVTLTDTSSAFKRRRIAPIYCPPEEVQALPLPAPKAYVHPVTNEQHVVAHMGEFFRTKEPLTAAMMAAAVRPNADEEFGGKERKVAKLSVAAAKVETFAHIDTLRKSLPADAVMMKHDPLLQRSADFDRVAEEKRNVRVTAYIYAINHEKDNDFHVIIGGDPKDPNRLYMNVEVSGLPPVGHPHRAALKKARDQFTGHFRDILPIAPGFHEIRPPVLVHMTGSLFYDISHLPDAPGPKAHKPHTSWEIHPVTDIQFPAK